MCRKFDGYQHVFIPRTVSPYLVLPPTANVFDATPTELARRMRWPSRKGYHGSKWLVPGGNQNCESRYLCGYRYELPQPWIERMLWLNHHHVRCVDSRCLHFYEQ
eukprot:5463619-Prymnesium_polylepis.1